MLQTALVIFLLLILLYMYIVHVQVVEHGERSLDIDFGDSDDEGERQNEGRISRSGLDDNMTSSGADVVADLMAASQEIDDDVINGRGLRREGAGGGERKGRGELDEDGFCVLDAPTTTYVVNTYTCVF